MQRHILWGTMGLLLAASCAVAQVPAPTGRAPSPWTAPVAVSGKPSVPAYQANAYQANGHQTTGYQTTGYQTTGQATTYATATYSTATVSGFGSASDLCCGQDFGCLWSTYCANKRRNRCGSSCNTCTAPATYGSTPSCRGYRPAPCGTARKPFFRHQSTCDQGPSCCDGSAGSGDIGQPPAPAPPSQEPSIVPAPAAQTGPAVTGPTNRSARRQWSEDKEK